MAQPKQPAVNGSRIGEESQGMPLETQHIIVRPDEMYEVDIAGCITNDRVNADTYHSHGLVFPADVLLIDVQQVHVLHESKAERADKKRK
jgi:hypothetical protein